jgi:hypothetical protein
MLFDQKHIVLLLSAMMLYATVFAADSIVVKKDPRLDMLTAKQVQINKRNAMLTPGGLYKGFRIQVVSTNRRDDAYRTRAELMSKYPDQKTYVVFQSPSFKVRIGNFIKKEDAEKLKAELNKFYPNGVYIVEDGIEYTPKTEDELITQ